MNVLLTGGNGMLGRAIRRLAAERAQHWRLHCPNSKEVDLRDQTAVAALFEGDYFDLVIHAAAKVGGIKANIADPVGFLVDNTRMNLNVIEAAARSDVGALIFVGSSCMYPKDHRQPLREDDVLAAPLEPTNEGYAISKITGAKLCTYLAMQRECAFRTLIPCNLYGPWDDFDPARSHLVASVIHKLHQAKRCEADTVEIWGDGSARREFLYVDDLAAFIVSLDPQRIKELPTMLNVGYGTDFSVLDYYRMAAEIVGFRGDFRFDESAPTGMKQKLMDSDLAGQFGWTVGTDTADGLRRTYDHYLAACQ